MKIKFEKLEQPSSSSEDESDAPSDSELNAMTHQSYDEPKQNGNRTRKAQEEAKNHDHSEDEEHVKKNMSEDSNQSTRDEKEKDEEPAKNQQAPPNYSEESNSPYNQNYSYNGKFLFLNMITSSVKEAKDKFLI